MKKIKLLFLALLFVCGFSQQSKAQLSTQGTDFWIGFMDNLVSPTLTIYISSPIATSGTITLPCGSPSSIPFTVSPGSTTSVNVDLCTMVTSSGSVTNQGIHVTANDPVAVFAHNNAPYSSDAALIYPTTTLGNEYYLTTYGGAAEEEFLIVGTQPGTQVEITTPGGSPYTVTLNTGETYLLKGNNLSGTHVKIVSPGAACNGVAVFSGGVCANIPSGCYACDHIYDQSPPVVAWGKQYILSQYQTHTSDQIKIIGSVNGTTVSINGSNVTLNAGQVYEFAITSNTSITADYPILVAQFSSGASCNGDSGDPFMNYVSPVEQTLETVTFATFPSTVITQYYINAVTATSNVNNVFLDGASIASNFVAVAGTDYSIAAMPITNADHTLTSPNGGVQAQVYGYGSYESFGYLAGASLSPLVIKSTVTAGSGSVCLSMYFTLQRNGDIANASTINFEWGGTATAGSDYTVYRTSPLTFPAGKDTLLIPIYQVPDNVCEGDESIILKIPPTCPSGDTLKKILTLYDKPAFTLAKTCTNAADGTATLTMTCTGHGPLEYAIDAGAYGSSLTFGTLAQGSHTIHVKDADGCVKDTVFNITACCSPAALTGTVTDVKCRGNATGAVALTLTGGSAPTSYIWTNGATTKNITALLAGNYSVTVTYQGGCSNSASFVVAQPATSVSATTTGSTLTCYGNTNGTASVTPTGGTPAYTYAWSNGQTTANATGLSTGPATVTVTDANGCKVQALANIASPPRVSSGITAKTNVKCAGGTDGSITLTTSGGNGAPYTYNWGTQAGAGTNPRTNLPAGFYTVTVTDGSGCTGTASAAISAPQPIGVDVANTGVLCAGGNNGTITVTATGGTGAFNYTWNPAGPNSPNRTGLTGGLYSVTVTDANNCSATGSTSVNEPPALQMISMADNVFEGNQGGISPFNYNEHWIFVTGGVSPYNYNWSTTNFVEHGIQTDYTATTTIPGPPIAAGTKGILVHILYADNATWHLTVNDAFGCATANNTASNDSGTAGQTGGPIVDIDNYTITNATIGVANGAVSILVSGGACPAPTYTYQWSGPAGFTATTQNISGLKSGWYSVTVTATCSDGTIQTTEGWYWVAKKRPGRGKTQADNDIYIASFPNPFANETSIEFELPYTQNASLDLYSVDGKRVANLFNGTAQNNEIYSIPFNANDINLPQGVYLIRLTTEKGESQTHKIMILK